MPDLECPLTELPASQCACPRHRGGHAPGEEPIETVGQPFVAHYATRCLRGCEHGIHPGDTIAHVASTGSDGVFDGFRYVHTGRCL